MSFSYGELCELQRKFEPNPGRLQRPEGTFRTTRCVHGFRCDPAPTRSARWLCEYCDCPWDRPIEGATEPTWLQQLTLKRLVEGQSYRGNGTFDALEAAGLIVGVRPTPAGIAYATGHNFWAEKKESEQ